MRKQSHFIEEFAGVFRRGTSSQRSSLWHASDPRLPAKESALNECSGLSKLQKQTHFMPDLQGFSYLIPLPLQGKGLGVRSAGANQFHSLSSPTPAISLRVVHETLLQEIRNGSAISRKQTHFMPDSQGLSSFLVPLPLQGKGLGVRSALAQKQTHSLRKPRISPLLFPFPCGKGSGVRSIILRR